MNDMSEILKVLRSVEGWKLDDSKDKVMLETIKSAYPKIDLLEEARAWQVWMLDFDNKKKINHRARFRNWCKKATEYKENDGKNSSGYSAGGRAHRKAEAGHGEEVRFTESW